MPQLGAERPVSRVRIFFVYYAARCFLAALIAYPVALALTSAGLARHPKGDALLFAPGATYLFEALRLGRAAIDAAFSGVPWYLMIALVLGSIPTAFLLFGLANPKASANWLLTRAFDVFPRFVLLSAASLIARTLSLALLVFIAFKVQDLISSTSGSEHGDWAWVYAMALGSPAFLFIGLLFDLARAEVVSQGLGFSDCIAGALRIFTTRPARIYWAWIQPAFAASLLVVGVGFVVGRLRIEAGDNWRWLVALGLHQAVVVALCIAEARWLKKALGFVASQATATS